MTTLNELLDQTLPLNRKERYYTGTVLPAIACADHFAHLHRLTRLLPGIGELDVRVSPDDCTVLFFTEYGLGESVFDQRARERFEGLALGKDTPDVVVLVTEPAPVLIALEAKFYDRPSKPDLLHQLRAQAELLQPLASRLGEKLGQPVTLAHAALLPKPLAYAVGDLGIPTITWEDFRETFRDVAPPYFDAILSTAIDRYPDLVSKWAGYQDAEVLGATLLQRHLDGDLIYPWMGRGGGLFGSRVADDVETGAWRTWRYQCAKNEVPGNPNWFAVTDFVALLQEKGQIPRPPSTS